MKDLFSLSTFRNKPALLDEEGRALSYGHLLEQAHSYSEHLSSRQLVLLECHHDEKCIALYVAAMGCQCPVFLVHPKDHANRDTILDRYPIGTHAYRDAHGNWQLDVLSKHSPSLHPDLALLLSTSGSTGKAKHIKLSRRNILANASSIAEYLRLKPTDRAATTLPMNYSYGLSVLNSHLVSGGSLWLTAQSVMEEEFWEGFATHQCTSFAGVPHSYALIESSAFMQRDLPSLRYFTQAGGKLPEERVRVFADEAKKRATEFFVMYGQTEATARIAYVPPSQLVHNTKAIGIAIPGGELSLRDSEGQYVSGKNIEGELIYRGDNIMMGYAQSVKDLEINEEITELATGDIARQNSAGLFEITGRKNRFIKPFGVRVSLDAIEQHVTQLGGEALCVGSDEFISVLVKGVEDLSNIEKFILEATQLPKDAVFIEPTTELPANENGKPDYASVMQHFSAKHEENTHKEQTGSPVSIIKNVLRTQSIDHKASFRELGGNSLNYIQATTQLEKVIGTLPKDWDQRPIGELEHFQTASGNAGSKVALRPMDTTIVARALSICMIVLAHFSVIDYGIGGALLLLMVAGMSFGRYQFDGIIKKSNVGPSLWALIQVIVPTIAYLALIQLSQNALDWRALLLISNFYEPLNLAYWFIEVYVQILILSIPFFYGFSFLFRGKWRIHMLAGLVFLSLLSAHLVHYFVWNTDALYNRVPHMLAWIFLYGILLSQLKTLAPRIALAILFLIYGYLELGTYFTYFIVGGTLISVIKNVPLPRVLHGPVLQIAGASLFIYLTHFQFSSSLHHVFPEAHGLIAFTVAILGGIAIWRLYEWGLTVIVNRWRILHQSP